MIVEFSKKLIGIIICLSLILTLTMFFPANVLAEFAAKGTLFFCRS
jgi:hypothetical protein